ncbi:MAG: Holliday junction resolvase RuvX [Candidatus Zixiibacteriota bacterium]
MNPEKTIAIDYGLSRVGLAISDAMGIFAKPYSTLAFQGDHELAEDIKTIIRDENIDVVVIGNPVHFSGDDSEISIKVRNFAAILEDITDARIVVFDERLTSKRAKQIMHSKGEKPSKNKNRLNAIAAAVILNNYLTKKAD